MSRAGIADARLHNLRHFYAAVLISAGYDIDAVSKALSHSSVAITSLIYTALFNAAKAQMATKAEALVWKDRTVPTGPVLHYSRSLTFGSNQDHQVA